MKTPAEAITEWKAGTPPDRAPLYRQLLEFDSWMPPINDDFKGDTFVPFEEAMVPLQADAESGEFIHPLFSCWDATEVYREKHGPTAFGDRGGWEMLAVHLASSDAIVIDPGMPHEFRLRRQEFAQLHALAEAVAVERVWKRISKGKEEPEDLALHGGMFVPIFTHAEALALAFEEFQQGFAPEEVRAVQMSGANR